MADEPEDEVDDEEWEHEEPLSVSPAALYSNTIRTIPGPYDLTIDFGQEVGQEPIVWVARISLAWEEALVLERFVGAALGAYQQAAGPVRDMEGLNTGEGNGGVSRRGDEDGDDEDDADEDTER